jgi:putative hemolysin
MTTRAGSGLLSGSWATGHTPTTRAAQARSPRASRVERWRLVVVGPLPYGHGSGEQHVAIRNFGEYDGMRGNGGIASSAGRSLQPVSTDATAAATAMMENTESLTARPPEFNDVIVSAASPRSADTLFLSLDHCPARSGAVSTACPNGPSSAAHKSTSFASDAIVLCSQPLPDHLDANYTQSQVIGIAAEADMFCEKRLGVAVRRRCCTSVLYSSRPHLRRPPLFGDNPRRSHDRSQGWGPVGSPDPVWHCSFLPQKKAGEGLFSFWKTHAATAASPTMTCAMARTAAATALVFESWLDCCLATRNIVTAELLPVATD